jgi:hypothetical protein
MATFGTAQQLINCGYWSRDDRNAQLITGPVVGGWCSAAREARSAPAEATAERFT